MATYATKEELSAYLQDSGVTLETDAERLLQRGERDVDRALGPYPVNPSTGLKLAPETLTAAQRVALSRATCAGCEFRLASTEEELVGAPDFLPSALTLVRSQSRTAPKMLEELSGSGLVTYAGTVTTA